MRRKQITALIMIIACFVIFTGCKQDTDINGDGTDTDKNTGTKVNFSETIKESDGSIYVDNQELSIYINIERESTDYWKLKIVSGADVFNLLEDNPPGKVAQDCHSWILEVVKPGKSVMEFTLYDENNKEKGNGYRFTFNVDDSMTITSDTDFYDLSDFAMGDLIGDNYYDGFAQETADKICESLGIPKGDACLIAEGDMADIIIDGNAMVVYGIAYEFDVGPFLAFDAIQESIYFSPHANGEYYEVIFNMDGSCELGEQAEVEPIAFG